MPSSKPFRERVELFATDPKGRVYGGFYPGKGGFGTFGGGVDPGEDLQEAAAREFKEESGYSVKNVRPASVSSLKEIWKAPPKGTSQEDADKFNERRKEYKGSITHFFVGNIKGDKGRKDLEDPKYNFKRVQFRPISAVITKQEKHLEDVEDAAETKRLKQRLKVLQLLQGSNKEAAATEESGMPFKSKAQQRFMFAAESKGELPKGTAKEWADATEKKKGGIEALPEKVKMKKSADEMAKIALTRWQKELNLNDVGETGKMFAHPSLTRDMENAMTQQMAMDAPKGVYKTILSPSFTDASESLAETMANEGKASWLSTFRKRVYPGKDPLIGKQEARQDMAKDFRNQRFQDLAREQQEAAAWETQKAWEAQAAQDAAEELASQPPAPKAPPAPPKPSKSLVHVPSEVGESAARAGSKSKFLRNLGIGGAAVGALGLGGYGAYRALRKDDGAPTKEESIKKSAAEIAEKVCTPEEKAKCCKGDSEKKDEKKDEKKEDKGNPFAKEESAKQASFCKRAREERMDPRMVGALSALPNIGLIAGPIAAGIGAPEGRGALAVGGNLLGQVGGAMGGGAAGLTLGAILDVMTGGRTQGKLPMTLGGLGALAGTGVGGGYGYHLATKDRESKEAACSSSSSKIAETLTPAISKQAACASPMFKKKKATSKKPAKKIAEEVLARKR